MESIKRGFFKTADEQSEKSYLLPAIAGVALAGIGGLLGHKIGRSKWARTGGEGFFKRNIYGNPKATPNKVHVAMQDWTNLSEGGSKYSHGGRIGFTIGSRNYSDIKPIVNKKDMSVFKLPKGLHDSSSFDIQKKDNKWVVRVLGHTPGSRDVAERSNTQMIVGEFEQKPSHSAIEKMIQSVGSLATEMKDIAYR